RHGDRIGHVQLADVPGRHEPGTGTIDFPSVLDALERQGYEGWVGLEYIPSGESGASLHATIDWLAAHAPTPRA
ncbi:MAG TPA: TIM barrel protein, partial [Candidatus Limnocylindrales bacterium]|nr:TIM barrel protein [Candidatus Limnocylindrales bacterium]